MATSNRESLDGRRRGMTHWRMPVVVLCGLALFTAGYVWWRTRAVVRAEELLDRGDATSALVIAEQKLRDAPESAAFLSIKGRAMVALKNWSGASQAFEQFPVVEPRDLSAWTEALVRQKRWNDAIPMLQQHVAANANDGNAWQNLVICRYELGEFSAALGSADRLAKVRGFESAGHFYLGKILWRVGDSRAAVEHWNAVVAANPSLTGLPIDTATFLLDFGDALLADGQARTAVEYLNRSQAAQKTLRGDVLLGEALAQTGNIAEATAAWERALSQDPAQIESRVGLAEFALRRADAEAAIDILKPVAMLPHTTSHITFVLQRAHTELGDREAARRWQQRTQVLRRAEKLDAAIRRMPATSMRTYWQSILVAYRTALAERWEEAEVITGSLSRFQPSPFVVALADAIKSRRDLPPLEQFPYP